MNCSRAITKLVRTTLFSLMWLYPLYTHPLLFRTGYHLYHILYVLAKWKKKGLLPRVNIINDCLTHPHTCSSCLCYKYTNKSLIVLISLYQNLRSIIYSSVEETLSWPTEAKLAHACMHALTQCLWMTSRCLL